MGLRGLSYFELRNFEQASIDLNQVVATGAGSLEVMEKSVEVNIYIDRNELACKYPFFQTVQIRVFC